MSKLSKSFLSNFEKLMNYDNTDPKKQNSKIALDLIQEIKKSWPQDYFEQNEHKLADQPETQVAKLKVINYLIKIPLKKLESLFNESTELDIVYHYSKLPEDKLIDLKKSRYQVIKTKPHKLIKFLSDQFATLTKQQKDESLSPDIVNLKEVKPTYWEALSKESARWVDFSKKEQDKIKKFSNTNSKKTKEDWDWLYNICIKYIRHGGISKDIADYMEDIISAVED